MTPPDKDRSYGSWVVISGDYFDGIHAVVGPFDNYEDAEDYMESHNMGHFTKAVVRLSSPPPIPVKCDVAR